jgi:Holliday junction DNA helicase RuvA
VIARVEGLLRESTPTRVVVDVNGVGYDLHIPFSTFEALPEEGKTVALHVHTHAREGAIQLFGFATRVERSAFELLLRANRVGPRLAQTVLSGISPGELVDAIRSSNTAPLKAVPGVGPKVAERMLVELRDRTDELALMLSQGDTPLAGALPAAREQALSALLNLGYAKAQAERVLADVERDEEVDDESVESMVRAALKRLAR